MFTIEPNRQILLDADDLAFFQWLSADDGELIYQVPPAVILLPPVTQEVANEN